MLMSLFAAAPGHSPSVAVSVLWLLFETVDKDKCVWTRLPRS